MKCPFCAKDIPDEFIICKYCGRAVLPTKSSNNTWQKHDAADRLIQARLYLNKRKFKWALQECDEAIKIDPNSVEAQVIRKSIQERQELYLRGEVSIFFGFAALGSIFSAVSSSQGELTYLGYIAMGIAIFLLVEGIVIALLGKRVGFLIDGIAICIVGMWNVGVSLLTGEISWWIFAVLGIFQLYWGIRGILKYSQMPATKPL